MVSRDKKPFTPDEIFSKSAQTKWKWQVVKLSNDQIPTNVARRRVWRALKLGQRFSRNSPWQYRKFLFFFVGKREMMNKPLKEKYLYTGNTKEEKRKRKSTSSFWIYFCRRRDLHMWGNERTKRIGMDGTGGRCWKPGASKSCSHKQTEPSDHEICRHFEAFRGKVKE